MQRALSLFLPRWSTDLARRRERRAAPRDPRRADPALLLVAVAGQQRIVAACCGLSAQAGVHPGMTLAHARALLPAGGVVVREHSPERDAQALHRLGEWALRFAPVVSADPPDGLQVDIAGCGHLFGGEDKLVEALIHGVRRLGLHARVAVAPTYGCAWAVARHGPAARTILADGGSSTIVAALKALPVAGLRIQPDTIAALREVGIATVGDVLALPRSSLPSRFGPQLQLRIDQAMGDAWERIEPIRPCPSLRIERVFDGATTRHDAIEAASRQLIDSLAQELARRQQGVRRLDIRLVRVDAEPIDECLVLARPSVNAKHLWSLLRPRLERVNLGYGLDGITLTASRTARMRHEQTEQWSEDVGARSAGDDAALAQLIDTLTNRLGPDRVLRLEAVHSFIPERAVRFRSALDNSLVDPSKNDGDRETDRPSVLLDEPEPIQVVALRPDGPIARIVWRSAQHHVVTSIGPERVSPEWWRPRPGDPCGTRDYFKVQDQSGVWLWVYRELTEPRWFVHGMWA